MAIPAESSVNCLLKDDTIANGYVRESVAVVAICKDRSNDSCRSLPFLSMSNLEKLRDSVTTAGLLFTRVQPITTTSYKQRQWTIHSSSKIGIRKTISATQEHQVIQEFTSHIILLSRSIKRNGELFAVEKWATDTDGSTLQNEPRTKMSSKGASKKGDPS